MIGKILYLRKKYHFGPERIAGYLQRYHKSRLRPRRFIAFFADCFCISCDISTGETIALRDGTVWKAALSTSALPGISVPVVDRNRLLVDGGVVDNLPASTMKELCGGNVILVDVGPERELIPVGDRIPSAGEIVFSRLLPHRKPILAPTIAHVMVRTTMISSLKRREEAFRLAMHLLRPPVGQFGLLEFASSFEKIVDPGYRYGMDAIARWPECGDDEDDNDCSDKTDLRLALSRQAEAGAHDRSSYPWTQKRHEALSG